jgi:prepilin-type N-terminal cleavage/methylation domain-containing protein
MKKNGFTLIELLVSIGIIAVLASVGFINLFGYAQRKNLELAGQEIIVVLRAAHDNSISQEQSAQWGVHFENTTSSDESDFYKLFYGSDYAVSTSSQNSSLPSGVIFGNPVVGQSVDIIFLKATGLPSASATIKIYISGNENASSTIIINDAGGIE